MASLATEANYSKEIKGEADTEVKKTGIVSSLLFRCILKLEPNVVFSEATSPAGGASSKEPTCLAGDIRVAGSIAGLGRSPGGGHGIPLQYSCLKNPMDRGAWWATVREVAKSQTGLSD